MEEFKKRQGVNDQPARKMPATTQGARAGASYLLPFGKYKGTPVNTLPDDYLQWLSTRELRDPLRSVVARELRARGQQSALQEMSVRLDEANTQGFFVVQEGYESDVRAYQATCIAANEPSICVSLGKDTATVAISYVGVDSSDAELLHIQQQLAQQWPSYSPHYLPPASIILLDLPCPLVPTVLPEIVRLLGKREEKSSA